MGCNIQPAFLSSSALRQSLVRLQYDPSSGFTVVAASGGSLSAYELATVRLSAAHLIAAYLVFLTWLRSCFHQGLGACFGLRILAAPTVLPPRSLHLRVIIHRTVNSVNIK